MKRSQAIGLVVAMALVLFVGQQARASSGSLAEYYFAEAESCAAAAYNQTRNANAYYAYLYSYYGYYYSRYGVEYNNRVDFSYAYNYGNIAINDAWSAYSQTKNINAYNAWNYLWLACEEAAAAEEGR